MLAVLSKIGSIILTTLHAILHECDSVVSGFEQTNVAMRVLDDVSAHEQVTKLFSQLDEADKNAALVVLFDHFRQDLNGTSVHGWNVASVNDNGVKLPTASFVTRVGLGIADSFDTRKHLFDHFNVGEIKSLFDTNNKNALCVNNGEHQATSGRR